jgi:hypothetical protein
MSAEKQKLATRFNATDGRCNAGRNGEEACLVFTNGFIGLG